MNVRTFFLVVCGSLAACAPAVAQQESSSPTPSGRGRASAPPAISTSGRQVTLDVVLIERPGNEGERGTLPSAKELLEMERQGQLERVRRVRLSMLSGGKGMAQFGERVPVVTGRGGFAFGGRGGGEPRQGPYSYTYESIGTLISASSRVEDKGGVVVELQVEESRLVPSGKPLDDGSDAVALQKTTTLTSHSTLRLKAKEPVVAQASRFIAGGEAIGQFVVVTAEVDDSGDAQAAAEERAAQIQVFNLKRSKAGEIQRVLASVFEGQTLRIGVNESTNAIIVSALPKQIQSIQAIVEALDADQK